MQRDMPTDKEVFNYMSAIKAQIDQAEMQQNACFNLVEASSPSKNEESKEEVGEGENLNDSSLSMGSNFKDDEENIMKDLQDIESEFNENNDMDGSNSFNLGEDDFDLDGLSEAEDVDVDNMLEESVSDDKDLKLETEQSSKTN